MAASETSILTIADGASGALNAIEASATAAATAVENLETAVGSTEKTVTRAGATADTLTRRWMLGAKEADGLARAQRELASATVTMDAAVEAGTHTLEQRAAVLAALQLKVAAAQSAVDAIGPSANRQESALLALANRMNAVGDATQRAVKYQTSLNETFGVRGVMPEFKNLAGIQSYTDSLDRLRAKFNPLFAVSKQYQTELEEIAHAERLGAISAAEAAAARDSTTRSFANANAPMNGAIEATGKLATGYNRASDTLRQVGIQSIDVAQQLASGAPVWTTFIQQGAQVGQVMAVTGTSLGALARGAVAAIAGINPLILVVAASAVAIGALAVASESSARNLNDLENSLRGTRSDYVGLAKDVDAAARAIAASTGIGTSAARSAGGIIAGAAGFSGVQQDLEDLIRTANGLAIVFGKELPDAAKDMASALNDPGKAAQQLAETYFPGMSAALAHSIRVQAEAGDRAGAFARVLEVMKNQTAGAADKITPLERSVRDLSTAFTGAGQGGRSLANALGDAITGAVAGAIDKLTALLNLIKEAKDFADRVKVPGTNTSLSEAAAIAGNAVVTGLNPAGALYGRVSGFVAGAGSSPPLPPVHASIADTVQAEALRAGIDPGLFARLQSAEGAFDETAGRWQVSSTGRIGPMQIDPATFRGIVAQPRQFPTAAGLTDINDPVQNVAAGAAFFGHLLRKYGDPAVAVLAYHDGEPVVDRMLQSDGASGVSLPARGLARRVMTGYAGPGMAPGAQDALPLPPPLVSPAEAAQISTNRLQVDRTQAFTLAERVGGLAFQRESNQAQQAQLRAQIPLTTDPAEVQKLTEALGILEGQETRLITKQEDMARAAVESTRALSERAGFTREMAEVDRQFAADAAASGEAVNEQAKAMAKAAKQTQLAADFDDTVASTNRLAEAQKRMAATYDGTVPSLERAQNLEKARDLAREKFAEGSDAYTSAVERYFAALNSASEAARGLDQSQQNLAQSAKDASQANEGRSGFERQMAAMEVEFAKAVRASGKALDEKSLAQAKATKAAALAKEFNRDVIGAADDETESTLRIAAAYDGTAESVTRAQNEERAWAAARQAYAPGSEALADAARRYADSLNRGTAASAAFGQAQRSVAAIADVLGAAMDRVGEALVNAFVSGQGAAVNFGNITKGVIASILVEFIRLAALNPLRNAFFGGGLPTLGSALSVFGGGQAAGGVAGAAGGGGSSGASSLFGQASNVSSLAGLSDALGFTSIKDTLLGWTNSLGITGNGGVLGGLSSLLSTTVGGQSAASILAAGGGSYTPATIAAIQANAASSVSLGGLLGGAGAGFGVGSLAGGFLQSALGKTGPGPTIGAGIGAGIGALATLIPGVGPIIGPLLAGILGGGAGGLIGGAIGPKPASSFSSTGLGISATGGLDIGRTVSQIADTTAELNQLREQVGQINQILAASGAIVTSLGGVSQIGQNTPGGFQDPSKAAGIDDAFSGLRFAAPGNETLNRAISGRSFGAAADLAAAIQEVKTFVDETVPALKRLADPPSGNLETALKQVDELTKQFDDAIATASRLGYAEADLTDARGKALRNLYDDIADPLLLTPGQFGAGALAEQVKGLNQVYDDAIKVAQRLGFATSDLTAAWDTAVKAANDNAAAQNARVNDDLRVRIATANAGLSRDPRDARAAALMSFDIQATRQVKEATDQYAATYGDSALQSADWREQLGLLNTALGRERSIIEMQGQAEASQSAAGLVSTIEQYVLRLQASDQSPLSAQARYDIASRQYDAVAGAAGAGNANSIAQLPTYADALLAASRDINASGPGFVEDFNRILEDLQKVVSLSPAALTEATYVSEMRTQTDTLESKLDRVADAVDALRRETTQQSNTPARLAS